MNVTRVLCFVYVVSRTVSVLFTVCICNWFLFSFRIHLLNDNVALDAMRFIGVLYMFVLVIWAYYAVRVCGMERMVGYVVDAKSMAMKEEVMFEFRRIMAVNEALCDCVGNPDIASLICAFLFFMSSVPLICDVH